ncbi:protein POLR1D-like [Clupea harengus]|uniref:Protein POLR1D-like n=1 Tax=Clupea harengus TaxID=7950 RepID=A0A6P3VH15_CLUHA|nr:protein POLR1D-like [Clupea harengus]
MKEDDDLERRAVEELLRESNRARARAETMGPTGWLKCPVQSTNKRFLLNTLRSTALQRRPGGHSRERSPVERGPIEESGRERTGSTRHREGKERSHKRDSIRDHSPSRRQSSRRHSRSPKDCSRKPSQPCRTRSSSPVHDTDTPSAVKQPRDRRTHK